MHRPERASYQHIWPREATPHTIRHLQHTQPSFDHSAQPSSIHRNPLTLPPINLSQPSALAQVGSTGYRSPPAPPLLPHLRALNFKEPFPDSSTQVTSVTPANSYNLATSTGDPGGGYGLSAIYDQDTLRPPPIQIAPMEAGLRVMFLVEIRWHGQALVRLFFTSHPT